MSNISAFNQGSCKPLLKTKKFSILHIELFEQILLGRTNRDINKTYGYTERSHTVVDHSRKVMYKLLSLEELSKRNYEDRVIYPRNYCFWWKQLLEKNRIKLVSMAVKPEYYDKQN
jgi:hypothetical protein